MHDARGVHHCPSKKKPPEGGSQPRGDGRQGRGPGRSPAGGQTTLAIDWQT